MLHLLFYLLLQLGLLGGPSTSPKTPAATAPNASQILVPSDAAIKLETPTTNGTDVSIGGSGWDDKN
jgi:hypothetical protein